MRTYPDFDLQDLLPTRPQNVGRGKSTISFAEIYNLNNILFLSQNEYYSALSGGLYTYLFSCENIMSLDMHGLDD